MLDACRACGFEPQYDDVAFSELVKLVRRTPPAVIVIDLTRLPAQGREAALALRRAGYSRHIPLVFVDGPPVKVAAIRAQLPDALWTARENLCDALSAALANRPENPVVPPTVMERYRARTTAQKLGVQAGFTVGVIDPPREYAAILGEMPEGVTLTEDSAAIQPVTLWFLHEPDAYRASLRRMRAIAAKTRLWLLWPKGAKNGLTQYAVRAAALEAGLVDYKICAVSGKWSGMLFARRKERKL